MQESDDSARISFAVSLAYSLGIVAYYLEPRWLALDLREAEGVQRGDLDHQRRERSEGLFL